MDANNNRNAIAGITNVVPRQTRGINGLVFGNFSAVPSQVGLLALFFGWVDQVNVMAGDQQQYYLQFFHLAALHTIVRVMLMTYQQYGSDAFVSVIYGPLMGSVHVLRDMVSSVQAEPSECLLLSLLTNFLLPIFVFSLPFSPAD